MKKDTDLEERLEFYEERLADIMEDERGAWWEMELPSGRTKHIERKANMLGYPPEIFETYHDFLELVHPEDKKRTMQAMRDHLEGKKERYEVEYRIKIKDVGYRWFRDVGEITKSKGENKIVTGIIWNINKRKRVEEREDFFLSLLRHDLNNKMQIIIGYLKLIDDEKLDAKTIKYIKKAKGGYTEVMKMIDKMGMLKKVKEEEAQPVDLARFIREGIEGTRSSAEDRDVTLSSDKKIPSLKVLGGDLLEDVFYNILRNAIRHSEGDNIRVSVDDKDKRVVVTIEDDGIGIPDERKAAIFQRGYSAGDEAGTGLGLYFVKKMIENYQGTIKVKDSELGGARFDIELEKV